MWLVKFFSENYLFLIAIPKGNESIKYTKEKLGKEFGEDFEHKVVINEAMPKD